jgi:hypothetical protein
MRKLLFCQLRMIAHRPLTTTYYLVAVWVFMSYVWKDFSNPDSMMFLLSLSLLSNDIAYQEINHIASRHFHGFKDDSLPYETIMKAVKVPKLEMTCGAISNFAEKYLRENGFKTRFVMTLTLDEWNSYNNGHSMIEIWDGNRWTLWDLDLKNVFMKDGRLLNAKELSETTDYEIIQFCVSERFSPEGIKVMKHYGLDLLSEKGLREFYKRCVQIVMIRQDGYFYFTCDPKNLKKIQSYPFSLPVYYLDKKEFIKTFYQ